MSSLVSHGADLWTLPQPFRVGGLHLGLRTTIVRLPSGRLWVLSPGPLPDADASAVSALGEVAALVAPNAFHHLYVKVYRDTFPGARVFASPGLMARQKAFRGVERLTEAPPPLWTGALEQTFVGGMPRLQEFVFLHPASRSLMLTDLCFNLTGSPSGLTRTLMRLNGAYGRLGPSRYAKYLMKDRAAVAEAVQRMLSWDFDRVIVSHGDVVETGGKAALRQAFAFLLNE